MPSHRGFSRRGANVPGAMGPSRDIMPGSKVLRWIGRTDAHLHGPSQPAGEDRRLIQCILCSYVARTHPNYVVNGMCVHVDACRKRQAEGARIDAMEARNRGQDGS